MTEEHEALHGLLTHPGWLLFMLHIEKEWGDSAVMQKIRSALSTIPRGDEQAVKETTTQILTAQARVRELRDWPAHRVQKILERIALERAEPTISRRGPNL